MAKIDIPDAELEQVSRALGSVLDHIDTDKSGIDLDRALGSPLIDQGEHFEKRWKDGRIQLHHQCETIKKAVDQIVQQMNETDQKAVAHLDAK